MNLTKSYIEKEYNVTLDRNIGIDDKRLFWQAYNDERDIYVDGWTLSEISRKLDKINSQ